ncbi:hypothetical protein RWE15_02830 [Virgibacillus halophilus]|uniref:Uncharacterized protein n=1 Tax=Tigheibacillus halophilus TaxID=361280 RepID=A0ABU5C3W2_9BACI|nr:hypothetical protein [Virgibacillus halophilus]
MDLMANRTIIDLLQEKCRMYGDKPFLLFEDNHKKVVKYTYHGFLNRVDKLSHVLYHFGVKKGRQSDIASPQLR